jgi:hypothetical protein
VKEVANADCEVEKAISEIFAPMVGKLIERGEQIALQIAPIRQVLKMLWGEPSPSGHNEALAFEQARRPLAESLEAVADFLRSSAAIDRVEPDPWIEARKRLREDAHAELPELDALLSGKPAE